MSTETWLTAQEALDRGLVDEILGQDARSMSPGGLVNAFGLPDIDALRAAYQQAQQQPQNRPEPDWRLAARLELEKHRI